MHTACYTNTYMHIRNKSCFEASLLSVQFETLSPMPMLMVTPVTAYMVFILATGYFIL